MKAINKNLKKLDQFGLPVNLTFNNEGVRFNTMCGGILSIVLAMAMIVYLVTQVTSMVNYDKINIQEIEKVVDYKQLGAVAAQHRDM